MYRWIPQHGRRTLTFTTTLFQVQVLGSSCWLPRPHLLVSAAAAAKPPRQPRRQLPRCCNSSSRHRARTTWLAALDQCASRPSTHTPPLTHPALPQPPALQHIRDERLAPLGVRRPERRAVPAVVRQRARQEGGQAEERPSQGGPAPAGQRVTAPLHQLPQIVWAGHQLEQAACRRGKGRECEGVCMCVWGGERAGWYCRGHRKAGHVAGRQGGTGWIGCGHALAGPCTCGVRET